MFASSRMRRVIAAASLAAFFTACYVQHPITDTAPTPKSRIIAFVTDTGTVLMANTIGPAATEVEGIVAEASPSSWTLRMLRVDQRGGFSSLWKQELVTFPRIALTNVTEKRLDKKRSWIAAAFAGAAVIASSILFGSFIQGDNTEGPPPVPPA